MEPSKNPARLLHMTPSAQGCAKTLMILLLVNAGLLFLGLFPNLSILRLYSKMPELYWHLPNPARDLQETLIPIQLLTFFITSFLFLMWTHRAYRNLPALHNEGLRFSPGWAVGWHFVPIMNLVRPYQVMKEIWKGSDPAVDPSRPDAWKNRPVSPLLKGWWALWIICGMLNGAIFFSQLAPGEFAIAIFLSDAIDIVLCIVAFLLVRSINRRQSEKRALLEKHFQSRSA